MGIAVFLIVGLMILFGLMFMPTIVACIDWFPLPEAWQNTPLEAIIGLLPIAALCLIILSVAWVVRSNT